jgi:hypothetical protein
MRRFPQVYGKGGTEEMSTGVRMAIIALLVSTWTSLAGAQTTALELSEELEPRVIGATGTMLAGFSGYIDRFFSSERDLPFNYSVQAEVTRFLTSRIAVRSGFRGSGSVGGDGAEDLPTGQGVPAMNAFGGLLYYFTPQSIVSFYTGADYWAQLTQRSGPDAGSVVGVLGVQGALSSRISVFLEGGYGIGVQKNDDDVRTRRVLGQIGVRLKF